MDVEWALEQCREWLHLNERVPIDYPDGKPQGAAKGRMRGSYEQRSRVASRVGLVAQAIFEENRWRTDVHSVRQLFFELEEGIEVREKLGLTSPGPTTLGEWQPRRGGLVLPPST